MRSEQFTTSSFTSILLFVFTLYSSPQIQQTQSHPISVLSVNSCCFLPKFQTPYLGQQGQSALATGLPQDLIPSPSLPPTCSSCFSHGLRPSLVPSQASSLVQMSPSQRCYPQPPIQYCASCTSLQHCCSSCFSLSSLFLIQKSVVNSSVCLSAVCLLIFFFCSFFQTILTAMLTARNHFNNFPRQFWKISKYKHTHTYIIFNFNILNIYSEF